MNANRQHDPISRWAYQLKEKSGWQKAVVALANKNARILWALFVRGKPFDAHYVSVKPAGALPRGAVAELGFFSLSKSALGDSQPQASVSGSAPSRVQQGRL